MFGEPVEQHTGCRTSKDNDETHHERASASRGEIRGIHAALRALTSQPLTVITPSLATEPTSTSPPFVFLPMLGNRVPNETGRKSFSETGILPSSRQIVAQEDH